jgi:4-hydroxy-tetrahydrodipicolinate reductase
MTRIGLFGAAGNLGKTLIRAISENATCTLSGGCDHPQSPQLGDDLGTIAGISPIGLHLTADLATLCDASDVIVDYSAASASMNLLPVAVERKTPVLVCTTGFDQDQLASMAEAGRFIPVLIGANMSESVIAMYELVKLAAQLLGDHFDIEIFDFHPWEKIDAPSGTAIELAEYAAEGRGRKLSELAVTARHGETGRRKRGSIGFSSARGGEVVCENSVFFAGAGQRLEIISRVTDNKAFVATTLEAAAWLSSQGPGFYSMDKMLKSKQ